MNVWIFVFLCAKVFANNEYYSRWKFIYITPSSVEELKILGSITAEHKIDVLVHPMVDSEGLALVTPERLPGFTGALKKNNIKFGIHYEDVKTYLDRNEKINEARRSKNATREGDKKINYDEYPKLDVIYEYLDDVARRYPDLVTIESPAKSFEGRPMKVLKISKSNFESSSKPVVFLDAGIHAREWATYPTLTYAIQQLVENNTDASLLENFDWLLVPVVNPDGYQYSSKFRMWRKTRSTDTNPGSKKCPGVDGNRNYDFFWDEVGTSPGDPCTDMYAGDKAFSEDETMLIKDLMHKYLKRIVLYVTIHGYASVILHPWGHNGKNSWNHKNLSKVGQAMRDAMNKMENADLKKYEVGNAVDLLGYGASGASEDYAHSIGIPLAYTIELPVEKINLYWHFDPKYLKFICQQSWAGIVAGAKAALVVENMKDEFINNE